jgi:hypothetical protein
MRVIFQNLTCQSRALVWELDENTGQATCLMIFSDGSHPMNTGSLLEELRDQHAPFLTIDDDKLVIRDVGEEDFIRRYPKINPDSNGELPSAGSIEFDLSTASISEATAPKRNSILIGSIPLPKLDISILGSLTEVSAPVTLSQPSVSTGTTEAATSTSPKKSPSRVVILDQSAGTSSPRSGENTNSGSQSPGRFKLFSHNKSPSADEISKKKTSHSPRKPSPRDEEPPSPRNNARISPRNLIPGPLKSLFGKSKQTPSPSAPDVSTSTQVEEPHGLNFSSTSNTIPIQSSLPDTSSHTSYVDVQAKTYPFITLDYLIPNPQNKSTNPNLQIDDPGAWSDINNTHFIRSNEALCELYAASCLKSAEAFIQRAEFQSKPVYYQRRERVLERVQELLDMHLNPLYVKWHEKKLSKCHEETELTKLADQKKLVYLYFRNAVREALRPNKVTPCPTELQLKVAKKRDAGYLSNPGFYDDTNDELNYQRTKTKLQRFFALVEEGFPLRLMTDATLLKKGQMYFREKEGKIAYSVITPAGEEVRDIVLNEFDAPIPFTLSELYSRKIALQHALLMNGHYSMGLRLPELDIPTLEGVFWMQTLLAKNSLVKDIVNELLDDIVRLFGEVELVEVENHITIHSIKEQLDRQDPEICGYHSFHALLRTWVPNHVIKPEKCPAIIAEVTKQVVQAISVEYKNSKYNRFMSPLERVKHTNFYLCEEWFNAINASLSDFTTNQIKVQDSSKHPDRFAQQIAHCVLRQIKSKVNQAMPPEPEMSSSSASPPSSPRF